DFLTTTNTAKERNAAAVKYKQYIRDLDEQGAIVAPILATTTSHGLKAIGPLLVDPIAAVALNRARNKPLQPTPQQLYSDGSLTGAGTPISSMTCGIASLDPTVPEISGRVQGFSSSAAAELLGLFGAIMTANPSQDLIVSLDNLS
ncbi:hypothetical protein BGX33_001897, partial [Mortierella sp. NVP41]